MIRLGTCIGSFCSGLLVISSVSGQDALEGLRIDLEVDRSLVTEIDPQTGEEITLQEATAELMFEGIRENYLYILEGSSDLENWLEVDRFSGEPSDPSVTILIDPFEDGFVRLKLFEEPLIPSEFVSIPAGVFAMGSPDEELGRDDDEILREVTISEGFYISPTEVTWAEWSKTRAWALENGYEDLAEGRNGRNGDESGRHPATQISWFNAIKWCNARSEREGRLPVYYTSEDFRPESVLRTGEDSPFADWNADGYRLPTEAEWEYACRAGANTAFHSGAITQDDSSPIDPNLDIAGWYAGNSESSTHPVGGKLANFFGLFDMHGNVREWCWDWYEPYEGNAIDPKGPDSGSVRVFRGGSWGENARDCRSANRDGFSPSPATDNYGFRLVLNTDS